jgi:hypothetical protein
MTSLTKTGCLISFIILCSSCAREPAPAQEVPPPPKPAAVDVGPQAPKGESDFKIVMNALKGEKVVPAGAADEDVDWSAVNATPLQVDKMGCVIEDGVPAHCHMVVNQDAQTGAFLPDRKLMIVKMPDGKYSLTVLSVLVPDQAIVCLGLTPKNAQSIEGTCGVSGDPVGGPIHNFAASIERLQNRKIRIHFAYRHGAFNSTEEAIHNGDGHATEP